MNNGHPPIQPTNPSSTSAQTSVPPPSPFPYTMLQAPRPVPPSRRPIDTLFAWLAIPIGFFFIRLLPLSQNTLGGMLMIWTMLLFGALYLHLGGTRLTPRAVVTAILPALLGVGLITNGNPVVRALLYLFLIVTILYWGYEACGLAGKGAFGAQFLQHVLHAAILIPFPAAVHFFPSLLLPDGNTERRRAILRGLGWTGLGLVIAVVPAAVIIALLSYDEGFIRLLTNLVSFSPRGVLPFLRDLIFGILAASVLFGAFLIFRHRRGLCEGKEASLPALQCHVVPRALLFAAVTPILLIYVLFFVSQWEYYVSAFTGVLPNDTIYSTYAREGFFQLCWVSAINALLLLLFTQLIRKGKRENDLAQRIYAATVSVFTLILIATALSKMLLYIRSYGLTQKRVYASWLMLLLAAIFIATLLRQFLPRMRLIGVITVCVLLFGALLVLPDVDGMIASYNVDAYLDGSLTEVDIESVSSYGSSSVPALKRLEKELTSRSSPSDAEQLAEVRAALEEIRLSLEATPNTFFSFNIPDYRARALLSEE